MNLWPKQEILDDLFNALKIGLPYYEDYVTQFNASATELVEVLDEQSELIGWSIYPFPNSKPIFKYIHSASVLKTGYVHILLHVESIEKEFDSEEFIKYSKHTIEHEAVHMSQRDRMGKYYSSDERVTGYQKMLRYQDTITSHIVLTEEEEAKGLNIYLSDMQEIMAHAHDLYTEMCYADEPITVLRDPEGFIDFLPTWYKYRQAGFKRSDVVMKRLLKYTYNYMIINNK